MTDGIDIDAVRGIPVKRYHTIIVGTGAAGYAATDCLYRYGVTDIAIVTEGRTMGTSRNTCLLYTSSEDADGTGYLFTQKGNA